MRQLVDEALGEEGVFAFRRSPHVANPEGKRREDGFDRDVGNGVRGHALDPRPHKPPLVVDVHQSVERGGHSVNRGDLHLPRGGDPPLAWKRRHSSKRPRRYKVLVLVRALRQCGLHRFLKLPSELHSIGDGIGFERTARGFAGWHGIERNVGSADAGHLRRRFTGEAGCLGRCPQLEPAAIEAGRGGKGLEPEVLARRDEVSGSEGARPFYDRFVITAPVALSVASVLQGPFEMASKWRAPLSREAGICGLHAALGRPPIVGNNRKPFPACGDVADAMNLLDRLSSEVRELPTGRRNANAREKHSGKPHVAGEAPAPVGFRGAIEPRQRLAGEPTPGRLAQWRAGGRCSLGRLLCELAEREGTASVHHEAVGHLALLRLGVPAVGGRSHQHRAGYCRSFAKGSLERPHGRGAGGNAHPPVGFHPVGAKPTKSIEPSLLTGKLVAVRRSQRRWLDRNRVPGRAELVGDNLRQGGPDALPGLRLSDCHDNPAVTRDLDEISKGGITLLNKEFAAHVPWPRGDSDDEPDARAAANQQCASIELQFANWALRVRRSILPVPRRSNAASAMIIRSGILNLARRPSRKARRPSSSNAWPFLACTIATGTSPKRSSGAPNTHTSATSGQA